MLVIEDNFNMKLDSPTYVALGTFDGIHRGHLQLVNKAVEMAHENGAKSMICTFKTHPLHTINKELAPKLLMDNETKLEIFENCGIDIVNMMHFDQELMKMPPEDYVLNMLDKYNAKGIITGFNNRFGYKNLGDVALLGRMGEIHDFSVHTISPVKHAGEIISSSRIRYLISDEGDMKKASKMLSRPYMIRGTVIRGKQLGRTWGFPTVNLDYEKTCVLPLGGVYLTAAEYNGALYKGITNVGFNPTVNGNKLSVETHILDFDKDIYGEEVKIHFICKIRNEKKFNSTDELKRQLEKDKNHAIKQKIEINLKYNLQLKSYLI